MVDRKKKPKSCDEGSLEDRINQLPDHLICHIFTHLSTRDVVGTSLLSKRWRNLSKHVPDLDLDSHTFSTFDTFVSVVDKFFESHQVSWIRKLRLIIRTNSYVSSSHLTPWIDDAITHKIQHLDFHIAYYDRIRVQIPLSLYTCGTLVHLRLFGVYLGNDGDVVSLPCLKIMQLESVRYPNEATLVKLISGSPILEDLTVLRAYRDKLKALQVCSKTLKRVYINDRKVQYDEGEQNGIVIDAPLVQFLKIKSNLIKNLKIINLGFTHEVDIDVSFGMFNVLDENDSSQRSMIRNFLASILTVRCLSICYAFFKVIVHFKKLEPTLQFCYLSQLSASIYTRDLKMLPMILSSCPKLKSLILELIDNRGREPNVMFSPVPPCLVSSLKFVELKTPILGSKVEMNIVRYFLKNSRILEKLSLRFEKNCYIRRKAKYVILEELLAIPRCSSTCEVVFL